MDDGFSLVDSFPWHFAISAISGNYSPTWGLITQQVVEQKGNAITPQLLQQIAAKLFCALGASYAAMMV